MKTLIIHKVLRLQHMWLVRASGYLILEQHIICVLLRNGLQIFYNLESGAVVRGNDQPCHTMGIRTIRLKMFDGMVSELKEVRYVRALKKNLISMGALEAKGYRLLLKMTQ